MQTLSDCELTIKKPDLVGHSKWSVILDQQIDVRIEDEEFLSKVRRGEINLSGGHKLICDLEIKTELDKDFNVLNAEYCVRKVNDVKQGAELLKRQQHPTPAPRLNKMGIVYKNRKKITLRDVVFCLSVVGIAICFLLPFFIVLS